jgi:hypothetical protein
VITQLEGQAEVVVRQIRRLRRNRGRKVVDTRPAVAARYDAWVQWQINERMSTTRAGCHNYHTSSPARTSPSGRCRTPVGLAYPVWRLVCGFVVNLVGHAEWRYSPNMLIMLSLDQRPLGILHIWPAQNTHRFLAPHRVPSEISE